MTTSTLFPSTRSAVVVGETGVRRVSFTSVGGYPLFDLSFAPVDRFSGEPSVCIFPHSGPSEMARCEFLADAIPAAIDLAARLGFSVAPADLAAFL